MMSEWAPWRLKSPASRLFAQQFIGAQIKENIKVPRHRPLCGEFTGDFPAQMASNAENVSNWWRHHDTICAIEARIYRSIQSFMNYDATTRNKNKTAWGIVYDVQFKITPWHRDTLCIGIGFYWCNYCPVVRGIIRWPVDYPHKAPINWGFDISWISDWATC